MIFKKWIGLIILFLLISCQGIVYAEGKIPPVSEVLPQFITVDFKDADINDVLRALASQQKVNIVSDEPLKGRVTIHLTKVPFDTGLMALLNAYGLTYTKEGIIYKVTKLVPKKPYTLSIERGYLTLDAKKVDINEILRAISLESGVNIVTDKSVAGEISIYLKNVPVEVGLERILRTGGFKYRKIKDIYVVGTAGEEEEKIKTISVKNGFLSLDIKGADIQKILREISIQGGINIVADMSVTGEISSNLENTPLEIGLRALLETNGFSVEKVNEIFQVTKMKGKKTFSVILTKEGLFTADLKSAELDEVLRAIAIAGNIDIVTAGYVKGAVDAHLTNVPLEELLRLILEGTNFTYAKVNETYIIGEGISLKPSSLTFINSEVIKINWMNVDEALNSLPDAFPKTNIKILKDQNALAIVGTQQLIDKVKEYLSQIDKPAPQIMIEALIVDYTTSFGTDLGLLQEGKYQEGHINLNPFLGQITYGSGKLNKEFAVSLKALIKAGKATIRANPRIATLNGHEANIDVLTEYRYREMRYNEATGRLEPVGVPRVVETGIKLKIKPWVTASNEININVSPEISDKIAETEVAAGGGALPVTSNRKIQTTIRVKDGETIIIGGLIQSKKTEGESRIPILGRIPIIGYLFKNLSKHEDQSQLVIYITPHILPAPK
ncbi:MAG: secretin N-terminal domain-containing protein [Nitrospirota bacterium]